jgi:hypothetical protein
MNKLIKFLSTPSDQVQRNVNRKALERFVSGRERVYILTVRARWTGAVGQEGMLAAGSLR